MSKIHKNNSADIAQLLITHKKNSDLTYSSIDSNNVLKDAKQIRTKKKPKRFPKCIQSHLAIISIENENIENQDQLHNYQLHNRSLLLKCRTF